MSPKLVINTFRANAKTKSETLGNIELKFISVGDIEFFEKNLAKVKEEREFVSRLIHHQLVIPELAYIKFKKITENELRKIARDFVKYEKHTFKYFKETTDGEFFRNFRIAIQKYHKEELEKLRTSLRPMIESNKKIFEDFQKQWRGIIPQIFEPTSFISELVKKQAGFLRDIQKIQADAVLSFRPIIEQSQLTASIITDALRPQINFWQNWAEQNRKIFKEFGVFWSDFHSKYKVSEKEAIEILKKYKWFVGPSLPINFVFEVVKIGRKKGNQRGKINSLFVNYFSLNDYSNLEELVEGWQKNKIFQPRMRIFRDCVNVLKKADSKINPSNLVLPSLIAQIDGIQQGFMKTKGLVFDIKSRKWKDKNGSEIDWKMWFKNQTLNKDIMDLANDIFLNILFQKSQPGKPLETPFTFNRHKIMHGEYLRYGRIGNTIRAFLTLDFLASLK